MIYALENKLEHRCNGHLALHVLEMIESTIKSAESGIKIELQTQCSKPEPFAEEDISNYFLGVISAKQSRNKDAFRYLKNAKSIKNKHSQFNVEFIRTIVLLEKFNKAFVFSGRVSQDNSKITASIKASPLIFCSYFIA